MLYNVNTADSVKVALGIGNCALGSCFGGPSSKSLHFCSICPNAQCPIIYQWPITKVTYFDLAVLDGYWVLAYMKKFYSCLAYSVHYIACNFNFSR